MARPTTKPDLLEVAAHEFDRLQAAVGQISEADRERPGACENWSVKDLLAHLDAWHEMFLGWEAEGSTGGKPAMPSADHTWAQTPELNADIHARTADDSWDDVVDRLGRSHRAVLDVIAKYSDDDLFTKKRFGWTGSTSVGSYTVSATSSHYAWASKLIRAWAKWCAAAGV